MLAITSPLENHTKGLGEVLLKALEPGGAHGAVHHAVVTAERDAQHVGRHRAPAGVRHQATLGAAHGENRRLRRVNDRREVGHAEHAQVGDGEGAALKLGRLQFA